MIQLQRAADGNSRLDQSFCQFTLLPLGAEETCVFDGGAGLGSDSGEQLYVKLSIGAGLITLDREHTKNLFTGDQRHPNVGPGVRVRQGNMLERHLPGNAPDIRQIQRFTRLDDVTGNAWGLADIQGLNMTRTGHTRQQGKLYDVRLLIIESYIEGADVHDTSNLHIERV